MASRAGEGGEAPIVRRSRAPLALATLLILVLGSVIGFAAFSADSPASSTSTSSTAPARLPTQASGRVAAAILATELGPPPVPTTTTTTTTTTTKPPPPPTTTTSPPRATERPASTTTMPKPTTTTTTQPPPTTTTTTQPPTTTTTTEPPVEGGPRDVEEWRPLVAQYFPAERVDEALAVMHCESKGDPLAVNPSSGASGLFQFVPGTWGWASNLAGWEGANVFLPEANIAVAAWLVQDSVDRDKDAWLHWSCKP